MMGERVGSQDRLFYDFCLEDRIPADHFLRKIDAVLDLSWLRGELAPYYSHTGCPSLDPELLIRMLIVGYSYSIRSERRLCQEVEMNLAYRWFCRLGLEDKIPHHSSFSVNRHGRFRDSGILRKVFEETVCGCITPRRLQNRRCHHKRTEKLSQNSSSSTVSANRRHFASVGTTNLCAVYSSSDRHSARALSDQMEPI